MTATVRTIQKSVTLKATPDKVWAILFDNTRNGQWLGCFSPGSHAEGGWQQGSIVRFVDNGQTGMVARITECQPPRLLTLSYTGLAIPGGEDTESDMARAMQGYGESYRLTDLNGSTRLDISSDMSDEYYDMMANTWDKALEVVREMAEE